MCDVSFIVPTKTKNMPRSTESDLSTIEPILAGRTSHGAGRYRANREECTPPIDRRGGSETRRADGALVVEGRRAGDGEGASRGTCSASSVGGSEGASVGGRGDDVRGAGHPDVL